MKTADFTFDLPERLIAQHPVAERGASRLMTLDRASRERRVLHVADLPDILDAGDLLVFNNSRVRKARLLGTSLSVGAHVEFLLLKRLDEYTWQAIASRSKRRRTGSGYLFADDMRAEITGLDGEYRILRFDAPVDDSWLDIHGHIPLPPYIKRPDAPEDSDRYQTVYAKSVGSAAAPTAGLHFTETLLARLKERGVETAFITLHVGLGTFLPVRTDHIEDHTMHEEAFTIDEAAASAVERAKAEGRRVIAVGTTSIRALESAWKDGRLARGDGATAIFIYPGYEFKVIKGIFTNFHTPESTLLMLVSAFAGKDFMLDSYCEAIRREFRFFSYGDAMLIL
ncbi:MAG: tRNA preQ1(34) S-adenosylmethionine ribosyltransferase-isomerase QueA [Treponema sp.]|jgi:S-adenosylmethionine:tRNA ribosyltransferase-isomerase|nr:tRNA preQ1(34) S-adenosylmethionine ribosyltransferase-isomerase QueA [Treponema sp.]